MERRPHSEEHNAWQPRLYKLLGSACVALALVSCARPTPPETEEDFVHPEKASYYLDRDGPYYAQVRDTMKRTDDPQALEKLDTLLHTPIAQWLNGNEQYSGQLIRENTDGASRAGQIPAFVLYNIPERDLGGQALGGLDSPAQYHAWLQSLSEQLANEPAIVVLEPDALADIPQMDNDAGTERLSILRDALLTLRENNPNTAVYLDAGNHAWHSPNVIAGLIQRIDDGESLVQGISLNVSNQMSEASERQYTQQIASLLGRQLHTLIDNSMNGAVHTDRLRSWCNTAGEHIGTVEDDIYSPDQPVETMFIKAPGESDGACGESNQPAGVFDQQLLLKQVTEE